MYGFEASERPTVASMDNTLFSLLKWKHSRLIQKVKRLPSQSNLNKFEKTGTLFILMLQVVIKSLLDRDTNPGPSAYMEDTLSTELSGYTVKSVSINHSIPVSAYIKMLQSWSFFFCKTISYNVTCVTIESCKISDFLFIYIVTKNLILQVFLIRKKGERSICLNTDKSLSLKSGVHWHEEMSIYCLLKQNASTSWFFDDRIGT